MWSIIEQSPVEDVTISNSFSSRGIFKIRSEEEVQNYPQIKALLQNKKMVIAIDKSIILLEDEMLVKFSFLSFDASIDMIAISETGNLIICGLSDGVIHGIFIKGIPLFNFSINIEDTNEAGKTFTSIQQFEQEFFITCTNGSIYRLGKIDENVLENYLNISINDTENFDENLLGILIFERLYTMRGLQNMEDANILALNDNSDDNDVAYIATSHNNVYFRNSIAGDAVKINVPQHYGVIKKIYNLEQYLLILTDSGNLLEICRFTKTIFLSNPKSETDLLIDEMFVMEVNDERIELMILTKSSADDDERLIQIIEYPSFKCISELDIATYSWLVQQPKCSINLYYLVGKELNVQNIPTEIEMVLVSETQPSERFKKLIAKGHLDEAESFGEQFELCLQPIYEAKAKRALISLSTMKLENADIMEKKFQELLELLHKIDNIKFFINNRMISMPTRRLLEQYLQEILKHLHKEQNESDIFEINEQLRRLQTLAITDPYECDMDWQKFVYNSDLLKMIVTLFKNDLPLACLIWKRHSSAIIPQLDENDLQNLLNHLPNNIEPFNIIQWLIQFVPTVSNTHTGAISFITEWSIQKTTGLQYSEYWPEIGLEFSTKVLKIFEDIKFMLSHVGRQQERSLTKLRDLVDVLQDLSVLKTSYNLIITLDNYMQDTIESTALFILKRVNLDKLNSLVKDFLYPIYQEKGKTPVSAIRQYIKTLISTRNSLSTWLERAVVCIELLHNEDDRLESALAVLQCSPVPWPDTLLPLIKLRYSTHPLASKVNTEYELQVIKIMKIKYGWSADSSSNINFNLLAMRIIKMNLPDMLDDLCILKKAAPESSTFINYTCCHEMVRLDKPEIAFELFKTLKAEKDSKYANEIIDMFTDNLENNYPLELNDDKIIEEQQHFIDFQKLITRQSDEIYKKRLRIIQNRFILRNKFHLNIEHINDIISENDRLKLLERGIENIIERSQATINVIDFITSQIIELTNALQLSKILGIRKIASRMHCLPLTCALAYVILKCDDCDYRNRNDFIDLALELLSQQIVAAKTVKKDTVNFMHCTEDDPLVFPLVNELLVQSSFYEDNLKNELMELLKYIHIANRGYDLDAIEIYYHGRDKEINEIICESLKTSEIEMNDMTINYETNCFGTIDKSKKRTSVSIFDTIELQNEPVVTKTIVNDQLLIVKFIAHTLLRMVIIENMPTNYLLSKLRQFIPNDILEDDEGAINDFFNSMREMMKEKKHNIWYSIAKYLLVYQENNNCKIIDDVLITVHLGRVFRNLMSHKEVNFYDLLMMLITDKHSKSFLEKLSKDLKTDQQKINLLTLSEAYYRHQKELNSVNIIREKRVKYYIYMEFIKEDPTIKGKFNVEIDNIEQLLKEFYNKNLNVQLLERICNDFHLDYQNLLMTQIFSILSAQEPQYEIKMDAYGEEELVMITTVEQIRDICQPYVAQIKNTELFTAKLKIFLKQINFYFYELYLTVLELLAFVSALPDEMLIWTNILHFLKHKMIKRRRQRPSQSETDMWLQSQTEIGVLPKISRYRLPFLPIVENPLKDILDSELCVDNCESWFPLIEMHTTLKGSNHFNRDRDYFCTSAVKNSIADYKGKNDSDTWHLHQTNNAFLKSILRLVKFVHNPGKAFMILYIVSSFAPEGADQVEASHECYKYLQENETLLTDAKYEEHLTRIKRKYPVLKTQHHLYVHGLTDEKLLRLVENPTELIYSLYHHELILKPSTKLDINVIAKEIAELHNLDIVAIQYQLLFKWLSFTMGSVDGSILEDTFFDDQNDNIIPNNDDGNASENVIRANYILNSWDKKKAVGFLVGNMFQTEGPINIAKQLQMYECFTKLNDGSACFDDVLNQQQYIGIKCVHELKKLGYNINIEKFNECNKIEILKTIWQRSIQTPNTLEIMANICLGFDIYISPIWNGLLIRMVKFKMLNELNTLVDVISCQQQLLNTQGLTMAWEYVLKQPFESVLFTNVNDQEEILEKALVRLQSCPIVHEFDLLSFADLCARSERLHMSSILMSFCKNDEQRNHIKDLILKRVTKKEKLRKDIIKLENIGILTVILNFALKELNL